MRAPRSGSRRMTAMAVIDLPEPDSPAMQTVSPGEVEMQVLDHQPTPLPPASVESRG